MSSLDVSVINGVMVRSWYLMGSGWCAECHGGMLSVGQSTSRADAVTRLMALL